VVAPRSCSGSAGSRRPGVEEEPASRLPAGVVEHARAVGRVEEQRRRTTGRQGDGASEEHTGRRRMGLRGGGSGGGAGQGAAALRKNWGLI
jgi:hypothetical protein